MYPIWPEILTDKNWQAKKGGLAKLTGETGVGEAMTKARDAFQKIDWTMMDASRILPKDRHDSDNVEKARGDALAYYKSHIEPVRPLIKAIETKALAAAKVWEKKALVPPGSVKHANAVAKDAEFFYVEMKSNASWMAEASKTFDAVLERNQKVKDIEIQKLATTIKNCESAASAYAKDLTKAGWINLGGTSSIHQRCRSMCNAIANIDGLKSVYWTTWEPFGDFYNKDCPDGEDEKKVMTGKLRNVAGALRDFKTNYQKHL